MPLVFSRPEPEKPKSRLRKAFTADHIFRVLWALLGTFDLFNGIVATIENHPVSAAVDLTIGMYMWLIAWNPKRTTGWIAAGVLRVIRGFLFAWRLCAPVVVKAATVPYTRLSDRYGLYGKTLRMRARLRRWKNRIRR